VRDNDAAVKEILLAEYEALKAEQKARIVVRDRLMYAALATTTAIVVGTDGRTGLVLLLPPVCVVLGWTYVANDEKISNIGRYLRTELRGRLATAAKTTPAQLLGWELAHRTGLNRTTMKSIQLGADLIMFVVPSVIAVVSFWLNESTHSKSPLLIASAIELAATVVLGSQIIHLVKFVHEELPLNRSVASRSWPMTCTPFIMSADSV
jgi:hypothetical protein